ncbi:MAG: V4R domain-containing protein [Thermogemmata sp.]|nr:V4R domain-containing protein [Thermogemmata sp.]
MATTRREDFTAPLDQPSEETLQLIWQEKGETRAVNLLKRPGVADGTIHKQIIPKFGVQPYLHNHYHDREFYRHDPERGTLHNPYGQRIMRVTEDFIVAILGSLEDQVGQNGAREIMYKCGYQWGLLDMKNFLPRMRAEFEAELDRMRVDFLMEQWWWPLTIQGWGTWRYDFRQRDKGLLYIELYESAVAQSIGDIGAVVCYFYAGLFAAVFSVLARRSLGSVEMQCYATGDDHCRFVVSDYERVNAAAFWRSEGATSREIMKKLAQM